MRRLFKDEKLQAEFEENGFVVVPMLTERDLESLLAVFHRYFPKVPDGFSSSSYLNDFETKKQISEAAQQILAPRIADWLEGHRSLGSAFLCKSPGENSMLPMHQDWTIVDEEQFDAVNIWTPLTTVSELNGTLQMLPGSHRTFNELRAPTIPFLAMGNEELLKPHMVKMEVKPGDAVILNQACMHHSGPNNTDEPRIAITSGATSQEAELRFNYWDKEAEMLETFAMDDDFLLRFDNFFEDIFQRPKHGESVGVNPFQYRILTKEEVASRLPVIRVENGMGSLKRAWQKLWA